MIQAVAVSPLNDMGAGTSFKPVLDDPACTEDPGSVEKVVFVSGKLYYDLAKERAAKGLDNQIALVRLEVYAIHDLMSFLIDNNITICRNFAPSQETKLSRCLATTMLHVTLCGAKKNPKMLVLTLSLHHA